MAKTQVSFTTSLSIVESLGFHDTAYLVEEGEKTEICLSAELEEEIVLTVMSSDGTALCK